MEALAVKSAPILDIHCVEKPRTYHGRSDKHPDFVRKAIRGVCRSDFRLTSIRPVEGRIPRNSFELFCLPSDALRVRQMLIWVYFWCFKP